MRVKRRSQTSLPMAPPSLAGIARPTMIGSNSRSSERARRVLQDIFLKGDRDPPGRAGDEADALIGIEPANRAHQSQLALAGQIVPRQARRAIDLRQFKDETLVAFGKLAGGRNIVAVSPAMAQRLIRRGFEAVSAGAAGRWLGDCRGWAELHGRAPFSPVALPGLRVASAHLIFPMDAVGVQPTTRRRSGSGSSSIIRVGVGFAAHV